MRESGGREWLKEQGIGQDAETIEHEGHVDPCDLGNRIESWLSDKGFQTRSIDGKDNCLVKAEAAEAGWKKAVGASPSLEVEITTIPNGTEVDVRPGGSRGAGVMAARLLTYSWVASGASYINLRRQLLQFARKELGAGGSSVETAPTILEVVETKRSEEPLGTDERTIDNSGSHAEVTRSIKATKRWKQTLHVEIEKSHVTSEGADVNLVPDLLSFKTSVEESVRNQYDASTEVEQTFEEDVTITVPANTCLKFMMDWKRLVQEGNVRLQDADGHVIEVPFEIAVGVTFDQRQVET